MTYRLATIHSLRTNRRIDGRHTLYSVKDAVQHSRRASKTQGWKRAFIFFPLHALL